MRIVICSVCEKEWQLRSGMAFESLSRHIKKEHKVEQIQVAA
jgi:DNA-directed RNA polymerase delta subunit